MSSRSPVAAIDLRCDSTAAPHAVSVTLLSLAFNVSLAVTVFSYALKAQRFDDVLYVIQRLRLLLLSLLALFVVTPTIALAIAKTIDVPLTFQVALVALALSMIPPTLPQKEVEAGGEGRYGVGLMLIVAALAPIVIPLLVEVLENILGRDYEVPPAQVASVVAGIVLLPALAGVGFGWFFPDAADRIRAIAPRLAGLVTLAALLVLLVVVAPIVWREITVEQVLAALLFTVLALGVGHLLGGPEPAHSAVLAISSATRHPAIALSIATANYPGRNFAASVITILLVNGLVVPLYVKWVRRREPRVGPEPT
jgi:BASS family bile acid:Na+ symporter